MHIKKQFDINKHNLKNEFKRSYLRVFNIIVVILM